MTLVVRKDTFLTPNIIIIICHIYVIDVYLKVINSFSSIEAYIIASYDFFASILELMSWREMFIIGDKFKFDGS